MSCIWQFWWLAFQLAWGRNGGQLKNKKPKQWEDHVLFCNTVLIHHRVLAPHPFTWPWHGHGVSTPVEWHQWLPCVQCDRANPQIRKQSACTGVTAYPGARAGEICRKAWQETPRHPKDAKKCQEQARAAWRTFQLVLSSLDLRFNVLSSTTHFRGWRFLCSWDISSVWWLWRHKVTNRSNSNKEKRVLSNVFHRFSQCVWCFGFEASHRPGSKASSIASSFRSSGSKRCISSRCWPARNFTFRMRPGHLWKVFKDIQIILGIICDINDLTSFHIIARFKAHIDTRYNGTRWHKDAQGCEHIHKISQVLRRSRRIKNCEDQMKAAHLL